MNEILGWAVAGSVGIALSWGITGAFRRWALKKRLLDYPNERSSHTRPTARGGGIGIVLVILVSGLVWLGRSVKGPAWPFDPWRVGLILAGGILIAAVSWLDDARRGLSPGVRLAVHAAAAGLVLLGAGGWSRIALPVAGTISLGIVGFAAALVWILGLVNAYNFMDGIDGIAGAQAVAAAAGWFAVGRLAGNPALSAAAVVIGASAIGFLIHNRPPARIFMGDIGSASLGYVFAVMPILVARTLPNPLAERAPVAGLLMVAPFVVDATFTFFRRLARRERLALAHRSHLYQRLVITGLGHGTVTGLYFILGVVASAAGLAFLFVPDRTRAGLSAAAALALVWGAPWIWASLRERRTPPPSGVAPGGPA